MEKRIIECVPNFSEGRDQEVINAITSAITLGGNAENVKLLDVDPGEATNRTVVTFVGEPEAVVEALSEESPRRQNSLTCRSITVPIQGWERRMYVLLCCVRGVS